MAGAEALKRRVAKLVNSETEVLRGFAESLSRDNLPELLAAIKAAGYPVPAGGDPRKLPPSEKRAFATALRALADRKRDPVFEAQADRMFRAELWKLKARHRMA